MPVVEIWKNSVLIETIDNRTLAQARAEKCDRIDGHLDEIISRGFAVTVNGSTKVYQIDHASQANIAAKAQMGALASSNFPGATWPTNFYWVAADNTQQPMSSFDCVVFAMTIGTYVTNLILFGRTSKDHVLTLGTNAACDAFDHTAGWPTS